MDKIYWLAGFDAGGTIYKIENGQMEHIPDYNPLWDQLWDRVRNS